MGASTTEIVLEQLVFAIADGLGEIAPNFTAMMWRTARQMAIVLVQTLANVLRDS